MGVTGRVLLTTARLVLREFTPDDVDHLVDLDADPAVVHFITGGRTTPRAEVEDEILPAYLAYHRSEGHGAGYGFWAVEDRTSGTFLGWFHLRPEPGHPADEPDLGYRLRRDAWGHGYATEGSRALVDHAFAELGVRRVTASTMVVNTASRRVMEKVGLRLVRTFTADWPYRIPGDEHGDVEYAITREQWLADRRAADDA